MGAQALRPAMGAAAHGLLVVDAEEQVGEAFIEFGGDFFAYAGHKQVFGPQAHIGFIGGVLLKAQPTQQVNDSVAVLGQGFFGGV